MIFFPNQLFVAINDKIKNQPVLTFSEYNGENLKLLNKKDHGIFFSVNSFHNGIRQKEHLLKLNAVYADLDVAKSESNLSLEVIEPRKIYLLNSLKALDCPPSLIIETRNGLQPLWFIEETTDQELYRSVIEGIIDWSKGCGALGDEVKDVTRVLRVPGFYHHKQEPFLIEEIFSTDKVYSLTKLSEYFKREVKPTLQSVYPQKDFQLVSNDPAIDALNKLDVRDVIVAVWQEKGCNAEFNALNQLVVDGQQCATFVNREGENFISNGGSSDYPSQGNAVTYVAGTLGISNKEAFKWILKRFGLENQSMSKLQDKKTIYAQLKKDFFFEPKPGLKKVSPFGIQKIAQYFVDNYNIKTMGGEKYREIYLYENGIYKQEGSSFFKAELEKILEEAWNTHWQSEIVEKIKNLSYVKREEFFVDKNLINLRNGIYNLETKELLPHDPKYLFLHQIPINFDLNADCPKINQFLNEIFETNDIPIIQEWFGFTLYREYFIKRALIISGTRKTGKSTFMNILMRFIGDSNVSGISLQKMNDKFAAVSLYDKHLNICDDLSANDVSDNGAFKMATGRSLMSGEYKFGDRFIFTNYAKLAFACNKIPAPKDTDDDAYFSRWMSITLQKPVKEEKMDSLLLGKILTNEELSGLLNLALIGLDRLFKNQDFSYKKDVFEVKMEMLKSNSSIADFAYNCLEKDIKSFISKEKLYESYANYSSEKDLPVETKDSFGKKLSKYVGYVIDRHGLEAGNEVRGWGNVKIKSTNS